MGDLRNKIRKLEDLARIEAMQRRLEASWQKRKPLRCLCGNGPGDTTLWSWSGDPKVTAPAGVYCTVCLPKELLPLVIWEAANLPTTDD